MKKYKITKFTEKEKKEIKKTYKEFDEIENEVWVEDAIESHMTPYIREYLKFYPFVKKLSQKMWLVIKLSDFEFHTSEWIEGKIKENNTVEFEDFNDEVSQRISLEECEKHKSNFIESKINNLMFTSFHDELQSRQLLEECEKFNSKFISKRIKKYEGKIDLEMELAKRQILLECEKHTNDYVKERIKEFQPLTFKTENHEDLYEDMHWREDLEQCEEHTTEFIEENIKFYKGRDIEMALPIQELEYRLVLEECEKYNTEYIGREIARLKDEYLIRDPQEELKHRMNLAFFEDNIKDKEKIANKDTFWDQISVHGLENMGLLKQELDDVGKGFCLAKWNQVSILLQTGQTHSCHHPRPHVVPLRELEDNPSALHNTEFKKLQRKTMLKGGRPKECDYCWNIEDVNPDAVSDRILKSGEAWAFPYFDKIKDADPMENTNPSYVEVSFSNQCNMSCGYCDVKSSSNWQHEIKTKGPYPTSGMFNNTEWMEREGIVPIPHTKPNPYRDAFWKWWPDMFPGLHTFRITGGEPLLHKDTFKVLDYIIDNPTINPRLEMSVNSNLCAPQDKFEEFVDKVKYITENDLIWNFTLFTSIESWGKHAEYMRDGMDTKRFWNNLDTFLTKCQKPEATIMATYNITSIFSYNKVIEQVFEMKKKHYNGKRYRHYAIILDTAYLRHPEFLSVRMLPTEWSEKIREDVGIMEKYAEEKYTYIYGHGHCGFYDFEREKLRRVLDWVNSPLEDIKWLLNTRRDFALYIDEFDKRRGKNFLETFPAMEDFYYSCKKLI